jgi:hypothetical protein
MELLEVLKRHLVEIPQLMHLAYVSIRQHTFAYVSKRRAHPVIHASIQEERCRFS